ncbi:hypothetical protein Fmac_026508 [Flemingia macrophylla]|uniref:Uncharacterized protein n=1 Tax=Flemingia macrophylla TaxID=520843 RepID=A0ABD1LF22_9FABA
MCILPSIGKQGFSFSLIYSSSDSIFDKHMGYSFSIRPTVTHEGASSFLSITSLFLQSSSDVVNNFL